MAGQMPRQPLAHRLSRTFSTIVDSVGCLYKRVAAQEQENWGRMKMGRSSIKKRRAQRQSGARRPKASEAGRAGRRWPAVHMNSARV